MHPGRYLASALPATRTGLLLALSALLLIMTGCSSGAPGITVTGTVVLDGKPLPAGVIVFRNIATTDTRLAELAEGGAFRVTELEPGKYEVAVKTSQLKPARTAPSRTPPPGGSPVGSGETETSYVGIPAKYEKHATSGLTFDIDGSTGELNVQLSGS